MLTMSFFGLHSFVHSIDLLLQLLLLPARNNDGAQFETCETWTQRSLCCSMSFKFQSLLCFFAVIPLAGKKFFVCSLGGAALALGRKWQLTTQRIITTRVERLKVKEWDEARLGDKSSICLRLGTKIMSFFEHRQLLSSRVHMYTRVWRYLDFFTFPVLFSRTIFSV